VVAVPLAVSVKLLVFVAPLGLNAAVTPLGKPEADKFTVPANPLLGVIVTVLVPLEPCATAMLVGDAARLKSAVAATAGVRVAVDW